MPLNKKYVALVRSCIGDESIASINSANDVEELGNKVAYDNAVNELWAVCGTIAKLYI